MAQNDWDPLKYPKVLENHHLKTKKNETLDVAENPSPAETHLHSRYQMSSFRNGDTAHFQLSDLSKLESIKESDGFQPVDDIK